MVAPERNHEMVRTINLFLIFIFIGCEMNSKQIIKPEKFSYEVVKFSTVSKKLFNFISSVFLEELIYLH